MAWQDRHYSRDQGASSNPLLWLFTGSVPLFTAFGVRVRMHALMILFIAFELMFSSGRGGLGFSNTLTFLAILFGIVLLHEFGHCFAARSVGGNADEIMMWPLGGLAMADAPRRPWPQFVTVAGGPLVNVAICGLTGSVLLVLTRGHASLPVNPFGAHGIPYDAGLVAFYLWWVFSVSWYLLLFNLLPIYPLDGGQLFRTILWARIGYYRASMIVFPVGMVGAGLLILYGLTQYGTWGGGLIVFIGLNCLLACYQMRTMMKAAGPWEFQEEDGADYSASLWKPEDDKPKRSRRLSRRAVRKLRKQQQDEEAEQARLDAILAKVSAQGMQSLTWSEKRALRKATERQRQREVELSRDRA